MPELKISTISSSLDLMIRAALLHIERQSERSSRYHRAWSDIFKGQQLRQGEGHVLSRLAITAAMAGQQAEAKENIEHSIALFAEVGADNHIPHLRVIRFLIDKECLSPTQARPWLAGILRDALEIREFFDIYWSLSALTYVLLVDEMPADDGPLPLQVVLAAEIRGFVGENLEFGQSAFMRALVHDKVDEMLSCWPQPETQAAEARAAVVKKCGRLQILWWSRS